MPILHAFLARFWDKVTFEPNTGCWLWLAALDRHGYGVFWDAQTERLVRAHRFSFKIAHGREPAGDLCHKCDTPPCVNPDHTYEGNHRTNAVDALERGLSPRGDAASWSKLNSVAVIEIRQRYAAGGVTQQALADEYGVGLTTVHRALRGVCWKHVG